MTRTISVTPPTMESVDSAIKSYQAARRTISVDVEVITPMFGGGHDPGKVDTITPISGKAIRGHLRFWWRATRGAQFDSAASLASHEAEIWGSTEHRSPVEVCVTVTARGKSKLIQQWIWKERDRGNSHEPAYTQEFARLGYVLFPFQMDDQTKRDHYSKRYVENEVPDPSHFVKAQEGVKFILHIACPDKFKPDVECALWAWLNFGGIGARTRRGCGALFCVRYAPDDIQSIQTWFRDHFSRFGLTAEPAPRDWPVLDSAFFVKSARSAKDAWVQSIRQLATFRQGVDRGDPAPSITWGRKAGGSRPGKSYWPEADTIRLRTNETCARHQPAKDSTTGFPRAALGLPIQFQFPGDQSCPGKTELVPEVDGKPGTRMASPLILRALKTGRGDCASLILRLWGKFSLQGIFLLDRREKDKPARTASDWPIHYDVSYVLDTRFASVHPFEESRAGVERFVKPGDAQQSAVDAFLDAIWATAGFTEIRS